MQTDPVASRKQLRKRTTDKATGQSTYSEWRDRELDWIQRLSDRVKRILPDDAEVDNPADLQPNSVSDATYYVQHSDASLETALRLQEREDLSEASADCVSDQLLRRLTWKDALRGVASNFCFPSLSPFFVEDSWEVSMEDDATSGMMTSPEPSFLISEEEESMTGCEKAGRQPPVSPPPSPPCLNDSSTSMRVSTIRRLFRSLHLFLQNDDIHAAGTVGDVVVLLLALRKPKLIRCLLRRFLDDVSAAIDCQSQKCCIQSKYFRRSTLRRSFCTAGMDAVLPMDITNKYLLGAAQDQGDVDDETLFRLLHHSVAVEDIRDALIAPCDTVTFCGVLECCEQLSAMTVKALIDRQLVERLCDAIRTFLTTDIRENSRLLAHWRALHEAVKRIAEFVLLHFSEEPDGETEASLDDDVDRMDDAKPVTVAAGWRFALCGVVERSHMLGLVCETLSSGPSGAADAEGISVRRIAGDCFSVIVSDPETQSYVRDVLLQFPEAWEYLIAAMASTDTTVASSVCDALEEVVVVRSTCDSASETPASVVDEDVRRMLLHNFTHHLLASLDIATSFWDVPPGVHKTKLVGGVPCPRVVRVLAWVSRVLVTIPDSKQQIVAYYRFHREVLSLLLVRVENAVLWCQKQRGGGSADMIATAFQYVKRLCAAVCGHTSESSAVKMHLQRSLISADTKRQLVDVVARVMEGTHCRHHSDCARKVREGLLVGVCCELLTVLNQS